VRILFLTDNFPPEVNAPASRTFEHCREWVRAGHQVTVITTAPNFPRGEVFAGYRNLLWQREETDGIQVVRVWSYITANAGFAKRTLDYLSFMVTGFLAGLVLRRPDVIVGTSPQFFTNCAAWVLSVLKLRPFVFELRDLWPESIKTVGAMKDSAALRALERLELFLYRKAAAVVAVTESFKSNLIARGIDGDKINVVTNGVDLARFQPLAPDPSLRDALGIPRDAFVSGYIGTHGLAHALETVLEAAAMLGGPGGDALTEAERLAGPAPQGSRGEAVDPGLGITAGGADPRDARSPSERSTLGGAAQTGRFYFVLLGDGAQKQALKARAAEMGLGNVVFLDTVPKGDVPRYWALLDAAIIHLRKADNFTQVIPSKLFESMGMGVPVAHGVEGESAAIVEREGVGIVFEPENAQALREALERLAGDPLLYKQFRAHGLAAASRYDRKALALEMLQVLQAVAERRQRRVATVV
jgi:glycosyltransferase involved in cell wall biosynthesis